MMNPKPYSPPISLPIYMFFHLGTTTLLDRDLLDPTYLVAPTYMIITPIDLATIENDKKICELVHSNNI